MKQSSSSRPYFMWDYDLTDADIRRILNGTNETEKLSMISRILTRARFEDIWDYVSLSDIIRVFPKLRMRLQMKDAWRRALDVWGYHV